MSAPAKPTCFQELILTLQDYWAGQGCLILQPFDMEMGAGTFHTATTLRALGPKPWYAAYVQPSRRPKDGRYGENPNRLQHYYQFQAILKPSPPDILERYLGSLVAIGIDTGLHDKGWTRQQVIDYMLANSAQSETQAISEAERYMAIPGQALAYKLGELKIKELRARSEKALGAKFDIRAFHAEVLKDGAVPLDVLEGKVDRWIAATLAAG